MKSMTGYSRREVETTEAYAMIELKSFNNRYLDIGVNITTSLSPLEPRVRSLLREVVQRGKVECSLRYRAVGSDRHIAFDEDAVGPLVDSLISLQKRAGIDEDIHLSHILRYDEQLRIERQVDYEAAWSVIEPELRSAIEELDAERLREGAMTLAALREQLVVVRRTLDLFVDQAKILDTTIREQTRKRFAEVVGKKIDEDRILAEIASLLLKFTIDEEIVRLGGHLGAFSTVLDDDGPVGKKLDFLCQELNREINTIGSKSPLYEINSQVVNAKDAIEKMREQLRNVE